MHDFETHYFGYSVQFQASVQDKLKFEGKISPIELQRLSDSLQSANEFRKFVVAGYDSCAITKAQYGQYGATFHSLDGLARQIDHLASNATLSADEESRLSKLTEEYIDLSSKFHP